MKLLKENNTAPMKTKIVYHGSFYKFDSFDMEAVLKNKTRNDNYGAGFYFTESEEQARLFGDYIYKCRIKYSTDYRTAKRLGTVKDYTYIESKGYWIIPYECVGNIQILDRKYVGETLTESTKIFNVGRVEVIQNPTDTEFRQMYKEQRELHPFVTDPLIRHTYGEFGNYYIWPAYDSTHYSIELYIYKTFGERTNQNKDYDLFDHYYLNEKIESLPSLEEPDGDLDSGVWIIDTESEMVRFLNDEMDYKVIYDANMDFYIALDPFYLIHYDALRIAFEHYLYPTDILKQGYENYADNPNLFYLHILKNRYDNDMTGELGSDNYRYEYVYKDYNILTRDDFRACPLYNALGKPLKVFKWDGNNKHIELNEAIKSSVGYRTETAYGSGIRELRSVLEFEIVYLGNTDIPDTLLTTFNLTKAQQSFIRTATSNIEDLSDENRQKLVDVCIDIIKREFPNANYCLWLADKNVIIDYYGGIEETIDEYEIENLKPISDLGWEGKLYVYSELPEPIRK